MIVLPIHGSKGGFGDGVDGCHIVGLGGIWTAE